jgi:hypothetical protein
MPFNREEITLVTVLGSNNYWEAHVYFDSKKYQRPTESYDPGTLTHRIDLITRATVNTNLSDPETKPLSGARKAPSPQNATIRDVVLYVNGAERDRDQISTEDGAGGEGE